MEVFDHLKFCPSNKSEGLSGQFMSSDLLLGVEGDLTKSDLEVFILLILNLWVFLLLVGNQKSCWVVYKNLF